MLPLIVAALALLGFARQSSAVFHISVIDEVATSYNGDPNFQFIEIRMLAILQTFVQNSVFAAFDSNGNYINDVLVVPGNVTTGGNGVRWLVGTTAFQTASGVTPDFVMPSGIMPTGGGMICYGGGGGLVPQNPPTWDRTNFANYVDCVAYGTYAGSTNTLIGTPTAINGDGHSLQRVGTNSTHNNSVDFTCGDPLTPENNAGVTASLPASLPCPNCPIVPDAACLSTFSGGSLLVKEASGKQKLLVKMLGGPALTQTDVGNPLSGGGTPYKLCIYDNMSNLVGHLLVDRAGDMCGSSPCWKALGGDPPNGKGYKYKDGTLTASGVSQILFKGGAAGMSKALLKGSGSSLPTGITAALQSASSATVQLIGSRAPQCLSVTLTDIKKSEVDSFKAKK
jgi:hypothetical protein